MPEKEYIIFCDESDKYGKFYSNFYGGSIVAGSNYKAITEELNSLKEKHNFFGEIKWSKVSENYLVKYQKIVTGFFKYVAKGDIKVRIMFTHNRNVIKDISPAKQDLGYFLLYYQFIKHAFGLKYIPYSDQGTRLRLFFDVFPHKKEKGEQFKGYLSGLQKSKWFRDANIIIPKQEIAEVDSHNHVILQFTDLILGAMAFRLNDKHKDKIPGTKVRGKKTIAKEKLYKHILAEIRKIRPNFNIGISTSEKGDKRNRWKYPYMHWLFVSKESEVDHSVKKNNKKKK